MQQQVSGLKYCEHEETFGRAHVQPAGGLVDCYYD